MLPSVRILDLHRTLRGAVLAHIVPGREFIILIGDV